MNTKMMEGLVGAQANMNLIDTPFQVYKQARRKGDMETMERAMGYVNDFSGQAEEYRAKADEGTKQDVKEAREKEQADREKAIEKRREEREAFARKIEEGRNEDKQSDTVEISEEGRALEENARTEAGGAENTDTEAEAIGADAAGMKKPPVIYTQNGMASLQEQETNLSVSV